MSSARDPRVLLWDAQEAARTALRFVQGKSLDRFMTDDLLRAGVERQLQIVGEALNRLSKVAPHAAERIPHLQQIIALRNVLVHGYATVDHHNLWNIVTKDVPPLVETIHSLLGAEEPPQ